MSLFEMLKTPSPHKSGEKGSGGSRVSSSSAKKAQSSIKSIVQAFGKYVVTWINDTKHLLDTVTALVSLYNTTRAIHRCLSKVGMTKSDSFYGKFPDLKNKLLGLLAADIENTIFYIKVYLKGISDLTAAMRSTVSDGMNLITDELPHNLQEKNDIFTMDHILTIQTIHSQIELEYNKYCRSFEAVTRIYAVKTDGSNDIDTHIIEEELSMLLLLQQALLDGTINDDERGTSRNENTFFNKLNIEIFLTTNNITTET